MNAGVLLRALVWVALIGTNVLARPAIAEDQHQALERSQAAIGGQVSNLTMLDTQGRPVQLADFTGKPVVISLIFTACAHSCSVATRYLDRVVQTARGALGTDSFGVLTIGFDLDHDQPETMASYAARHSVRDPNWHFLSLTDEHARDRLTTELGFSFQPSPRGFDHIVQVTLLDAEARVYRQVYGEIIDTPRLVEPLKDLVLGRPASDDGLLTRLGKRVRLFCTVYDARGDRYYFDYSLFVGILIGLLVLGTVSIWLFREVRLRRRTGTAA